MGQKLHPRPHQPHHEAPKQCIVVIAFRSLFLDAKSDWWLDFENAEKYEHPCVMGVSRVLRAAFARVPPIRYASRMSCMFSIVLQCSLVLVCGHGGAALPVIIPSQWVALGAMRPDVGGRCRAWHSRGHFSN